jgi:hypothetical protein
MTNDDELAKRRLQLSNDTELRAFRELPEHSKAQLNKLREEQRKFGLSSDSGQYAAHVYQVFNDPDFDADIIKLRKLFDKMYYPMVSLTTDYLDPHLLLEDKNTVKTLADRYCISLEDLGIYADGQYEAGMGFGKLVYEYGGFITNNSPYYENMGFFYALGPKTTLQQITNEWNFIQEYMTAMFHSTNTKSKSPENPSLIYAVFKARANGLTFTEIFRQYQDGVLKLYSGTNTNQYSSKDSLERYYRKYMPMPLGEVLIARKKIV